MKKLLLTVLILFGVTANAAFFNLKPGRMYQTTAVGTSSPVAGPATAGRKTFQATVTGTGTLNAVVTINVSDDNVAFITLGTITLSGSGTATDGFASEASWAYYTASVTAISGTNATVTVTSAQE